MTIHILAAVAVDEAARISDCAKAALAAYKASGRTSKRIKMACPQGVPAEVVEQTAGKARGRPPQFKSLTPEARARGAARSSAARRAAAVEACADLATLVSKLRGSGWTLQRIADRLNE